MEWVLVKCDWCGGDGVMHTNPAGRLACDDCLGVLMLEHDDLVTVKEFSDEGDMVPCEEDAGQREGSVACVPWSPEIDKQNDEDFSHEMDGEEHQPTA